MTNEFAVRNRAEMQLPRNTVSMDGPVINFDDSIAVLRQGTNPEPTVPSLMNITPKSFFQRSVWPARSARSAALPVTFPAAIFGGILNSLREGIKHAIAL